MDNWFNFIHALPLWSAKVAAAVMFCSLLVLIWLPVIRLKFLQDSSGGWKDLRIWATVLILLQFVIYTLF